MPDWATYQPFETFSLSVPSPSGFSLAAPALTLTRPQFLATVRGDLSNITAPPFILAPQSLAEFPAYWGEHPALFAAAAQETLPERRTLLILKFYLASLQRQYYVGRAVKDGLKKPLNPFLGELFFGEYKDPAGKARVKIISEQVSHHPPTTACYLSDEENKIWVSTSLTASGPWALCTSLSDANTAQAEAYSTQSTALSGASILIRQSGHALLTVGKYDETYLLPLPDVWARGVMSGVPYPELNGTYKIVSSSGYTAEMRFSGKRFWQTGRNMFEAAVYKTDDDDKRDIFVLSGSWSDSFTIRDADGNTLETYEVEDPKNAPAPLTIEPLHKQHPWESRRAWAPVIESLRNGDVAKVLAEKSKLENAQREMRRKEKAEGRTWKAAFFSQHDDDQLDGGAFDELTRSLNDCDVERLLGSNGCWRFDKHKARRWWDGGEKGRQGGRPETPLG